MTRVSEVPAAVRALNEVVQLADGLITRIDEYVDPTLVAQLDLGGDQP